jgi:hypothetical protein
MNYSNDIWSSTYNARYFLILTFFLTLVAGSGEWISDDTTIIISHTLHARRSTGDNCY